MRNCLIHIPFALSLLCFSFSLQGQLQELELIQQKEEVKQEKKFQIIPPNPFELERDWGKYLDVKGGRLEEHSKKLQANLQTILKGSPLQEDEEARELLQRIELQLHALRSVEQYPSLLSPQPRAFKKIYSIDAMIEVSRDMRIAESEAEASKEALEQRGRFIEVLGRQRDRLFDRYEVIEERTPKKLLLGIQVIATTIATDIAHHELKQLERTIAVHRERAKLLHEEFLFAKDHIDTSDKAMDQALSRRKQAEEQYKKAQDELEKKEEEALSTLSAKGQENGTAENQLLRQEVIFVSLMEAQAYVELLMGKMEVLLLQLYRNPKDFDLNEVNVEVGEWEDQIDTLAAKADEWRTEVQEAQKLAGRTLSLIDLEEDRQESKKIVQRQQEVISISQKAELELQKLDSLVQDAYLLSDLLDQELSSLLGLEVKWLKDTWLWAVWLVVAFRDSLNDVLFSLGKTEITPLGILYFFIILILSFWLAKLVVRGMSRIAEGHKPAQRSLMYRISRLIKYVIIAMGVFIALSALGFDFSSFIIVAGALGVGLGFGLQDIFHNFIAGIILLAENHLKVGDYIELQDGQKGRILEIHFRSTNIITNDGVEILVPNKEMINTRVINWTLRDPFRRVHIPFTIPYGVDKEKAVALVEEEVKKVSSTLQRSVKAEPKVRLHKLGDNGLEFQLIVWVHERVATREVVVMHDFLWAIETVLRKNGFTIPFPQLDVHFDKEKE